MNWVPEQTILEYRYSNKCRCNPPKEELGEGDKNLLLMGYQEEATVRRRPEIMRCFSSHLLR